MPWLADLDGCMWPVIVFVVLIAVGAEEGGNWWGRRGRRRWYGQSIAPFPGAHATVTRNVERDVIDLPRPADRPARVRFFHHLLGDGSARRRVDYTEYTAVTPWRGGAMRVSSPEWRGAIDRYYGGRDIAIGDPAFDERYLIQANPTELARHFLDDGLRARIRRLDAQGTGPLLFQLRPEQLLVRVSRRLQQGTQLQTFIEECGAIADRLSGEPAGVMIEEVSIGNEAKCQVCGSGIEPGKRVLCAQCRTPSHADCWQYNDGCAIFACGGRRMARG